LYSSSFSSCSCSFVCLVLVRRMPLCRVLLVLASGIQGIPLFILLVALLSGSRWSRSEIGRDPVLLIKLSSVELRFGVSQLFLAVLVGEGSCCARFWSFKGIGRRCVRCRGVWCEAAERNSFFDDVDGAGRFWSSATGLGQGPDRCATSTTASSWRATLEVHKAQCSNGVASRLGVLEAAFSLYVGRRGGDGDGQRPMVSVQLVPGASLYFSFFEGPFCICTDPRVLLVRSGVCVRVL